MRCPRGGVRHADWSVSTRRAVGGILGDFTHVQCVGEVFGFLLLGKGGGLLSDSPVFVVFPYRF